MMSCFEENSCCNSESICSSSYDRLRYLFETCGDSNYIGEEVSIIEHSLQAAYFASRRSTDTELIIASLLHDIGHALGLEVEREMVNTTLYMYCLFPWYMFGIVT